MNENKYSKIIVKSAICGKNRYTRRGKKYENT